MSWTNKSLKQLNQERNEIKEVAEELYHTFMKYLPWSVSGTNELLELW